MNDQWNVRIWLRDWLQRPSKAELAERRTAEAAAAQTSASQENEQHPASRHSFQLDSSARITGLSRPSLHREST